MPSERRKLTVYRIRDYIAGQRVRNFEDALLDPGDLIMYDLTGSHNYEARLFVQEPEVKRPDWAEFLESAFGEVEEIGESASYGAVIIMKVRYYRKDRFFALTFGSGRYLLRPDSFERGYGLRVALNSIYGGQATEQTDPARIRRVDHKTVSTNTLHTSRQADRWATFEIFGVDAKRDLLKAVTGEPMAAADWGTRITGADALHLNIHIEIDDLGDRCKKIERTHSRDDYKEGFAWIDNVHAIVDPNLKAGLEGQLLENLRNREAERLEASPPELVDWDEIADFRFSFEPDSPYGDLELEQYLTVLKDTEKLDGLTLAHLRTAHKVEVYDEDGNVFKRWPLFRCLNGELDYEGKTYLLNEGEFFEIEPEYLNNLDRFIGNLQEWGGAVPDSVGDMNEGDYNESAADSSSDYLLLDKKLVRISGRTTQIEICDILTKTGAFVHVKRKLGSSSLSHLFSQGLVSADLLLMSREYREAVLKKVSAAERSSGRPGGFSNLILPGGISPKNHEIVYAIVAKWGNRDLVGALPFFSKVNLRWFTEGLRRMGYPVSYKRVQVV